MTVLKARHPARIIGAYEHPARKLPGYTLDRLYLEIMAGALRDAGMTTDDIDGLVVSTVPGWAPSMAETLGLNGLRFIDSTDTGGSTYVSGAGRAARAVQEGRCRAVLVIHGGLPLQGLDSMPVGASADPFEIAHGSFTVPEYAMVARRHMHQYGTTPETLAGIKVAASVHAQHNPNALLRTPVTVEEVLDSPWIAEPLHRLDCCVTTDGGGAIVVVSEETAKERGSGGPKILATEEAITHSRNGSYDLATSISATTGRRALETAGISVADVDYVSVYDSFTITALVNLEGLGFFEPGQGGRLIADGQLIAPDGRIPINTDGGGLCSSHPDRRGGMARMLEAVRQLRGEARPAVQVRDAEFAVVHGSGMSMGTRAAGATAILQRGDA
ncbi:thiolase C-terminal domain-containing protein [Microbacterium ulmi]|uniref:Thiolase domain-containing protein n=1 Tax=Microbacterium ulmi TaxID=179095 RepID=A0A7Y2M055_9MICO|nr:thiolase domain-containing protein [Microbacterium ulmi]NII68969.1 acetyl-CoA C-acetyltransferase [Microbacterium ulmi]NNH03952.1 thiolase domain-containing protein [Microbacterium ulmi]